MVYIVSGLFRLSESELKSEKDQRTSGRDQRKNFKHQYEWALTMNRWCRGLSRILPEFHGIIS